MDCDFDDYEKHKWWLSWRGCIGRDVKNLYGTPISRDPIFVQRVFLQCFFGFGGGSEGGFYPCLVFMDMGAGGEFRLEYRASPQNNYLYLNILFIKLNIKLRVVIV